MSGGGSGFRVSAVSGNVRRMIQSIKEIGSNHTEEEIYAMLKECGMDPNDAAQKLLLQDTFHEVKRRRERKKENVNSRETADSRWRSGPSGRVGRGGQGSFSSRYPADAGGGKHSVSATENGVKESACSTLPISGAKESKLKETASASSLTHNSLKHMLLGDNVDECTPHISIASAKHAEVSSAVQPQSDVAGNSSVISGGGMNSEYRRPQPRSSKSSRPAAVTSSGKPSASDPVPVQSDESRPPGAIDAITHETGSQQSHIVPSLIASVESKLNAAHESKSLSGQARMSSKPRGTGKNQLTEFSRPPSSGHGGSSSSRPSSNYGSRSQQAIGPPKGVSKEWKPKATNSSTVLVSMPQQASPAAKPDDQDHAVHASINGYDPYEEAASKVERELDGLHIKETQHVIIPNHIHVPEAVRTGLSFGSFDAALVVNSSCVNDCTIEKCAEPTSMSYQAVEDTEVEQAVSNDDVVAAPESIDHPESSIHVPENFPSSSADVPSSSVSDISNSKETSGIPQQSVEYASPAYNFAVVPTPVPGNVAAFDNSDPLVRDASRVPSFIVQHSVDPASASFYAQFYRSNEADGRISSFSSPGVSTMYTGNVSMLSAEMSESSQSQEGGNPVTLSTTGQASLATQAGVMASNIAVSQQAVSVFRQPPGMPVPHYAPNIIPYGHYFSPFYVPSPAIPQFLGNNAFLQQGQISTVYPGPPTGSAAGIKYPISQFKPGSNSGNPAHMGVTGSYGPYGTSPAGYNGSAATAGNSPNSEDRAGSQYKENIIYAAGQQSEGSAVWIAAPGREISGLQANSFYNLPQGQHMAFTPSQATHSPFTGIYHPAQAVTAGALHPILQQSQGMPGAVDIAGAAPAGIYQQPQHGTQMNWPSNY